MQIFCKNFVRFGEINHKSIPRDVEMRRFWKGKWLRLLVEIIRKIFLAHRNREHRTPRLRNTAENRTPKAANGDKNIAKWDDRNDIPDNGRWFEPKIKSLETDKGGMSEFNSDAMDKTYSADRISFLRRLAKSIVNWWVPSGFMWTEAQKFAVSRHIS